jgi:hypothetical protein
MFVDLWVIGFFISIGLNIGIKEGTKWHLQDYLCILFSLLSFISFKNSKFKNS